MHMHNMKKRLLSISMVFMFLISIMVAGCAVQQAETLPDDEDSGLEIEEEFVDEVVTVPDDEPDEEAEPEPAAEEEEDETDYNFESLPRDEQRKVKLIRKAPK